MPVFQPGVTLQQSLVLLSHTKDYTSSHSMKSQITVKDGGAFPTYRAEDKRIDSEEHIQQLGYSFAGGKLFQG
jgi:hypothetical protein